MTTYIDCDFAGTVGATVSSPYTAGGFDSSPGNTTFETSTVSGKGTAAKTVNGIAGSIMWRVDVGGQNIVYFDFLWNHETADTFGLVECCDTTDGFVIAGLRVNSAGQFLLRKGDEWTGAATTEDTSTITYTPGNWIRVQAKFNRTAGTTEAKIYLTPTAASPDETLTGTCATTDAFGWLTMGTGGAPGDTYLGTAWIDDAWVSDAAYRAAASFSGDTSAIVEIAFASAPYDTTPVWTDVTAYVDALNYPISIERGRADSFEAATPGICTFVLNNDDKRFTPGYTGGPYGSNVKIGKRIRVTVPHNGTDYRRFVGFISSFDMGWPTGVTQQNRVQVTAVDLLGMMEQVKLRNVVAHTYIASDPVALWPLDDKRGSGGAMEISGVRQPRLKKIERGGGGAARFGDGEGLRAFPDGKKDRAIRFKSDQDDPSWTALGNNSISLESATTSVGFGGWVNFDGDQDPDSGIGPALASLKLTDVTSGDGAFVIGTTDKGRAYANILDNSFLATFAPPHAIGPRIDDGSWHHIYAVYTETGNGVITLYIDGEEVATSAAYGAGYPTIPATTTVTIGAGRSVDGTKYEYSPVNARMAYWGIWTDDTAVDLDVASLYEAGWRAWDSKDRTSTRIQRLGVWMGLSSNQRSLETGMSFVDIGDMKGMSCLEYANQVTAGEQGFLFVAGDGVLTFHARDHRYDGVSEATLSWHQPDETFTTDLEQIINTVTVSHNKDGEVRVQDNDSRATYGPRELTLDAALTDANQAQGIADYVLKLRETLTPRLSQFTYDLLTEDTASVRDDVLGLELGDLFTIDSLPSQAHVSSFDVWIEGIRETIGVDEWRTTFITTPDKGLGGFWILGTTAFDDPAVLAY